jgi:PAS domain S-box-containing protein
MKEAENGHSSGASEEKPIYKRTHKYLTEISGGLNESSTVTREAPIGLVEGTPLHTVLRLLPIPVFLVDQSHRIRFVNRAGKRIGQDDQSVRGNNISSLFPRRSDYLAVRGLLEGISSRGQAQTREGDIRVGSKGENWRIHMSALSLQGEQFTLIFAEDKGSQQEASVLSETCRTLVKVFPGGVAQFQLWAPAFRNSPLDALTSNIMNAQLVDGNSEFAQMHGFTDLNELRGARLSEFVLPGSYLEKMITGWLETGLSVHQAIIEEASTISDRTQVEVQLVAEIRDDRLFSFWMAKRSLKKLNQTESSLRDIECRLRTVLDQVDDLILIKGRDSRYIDANIAAERLLGLNRSVILGKSAEEIWGAESGSKIQNNEFRALEGKTSEHICTYQVNGVANTIHVVTTPVRAAAGDIIGLLEVGHRVPDQLESPGKASETDHVRPTRLPVCNSDAMRKTLERVWVAAKTDAIVLISGETGAGKDFLARVIHDRSNRAGRPYLGINCAAVPLSLAESELFGYEAGAFTGANKRKKGLLELADGGTLLMNEIGDLPLPLQAKLLTFLDSKSFSRVGGQKQITVDVRILAATNRNLRDDVVKVLFRKDLFYRLNVLTLEVPPLRERPEDLPPLIHQILLELAEQNNLPSTPGLESSLLKALKDYHWPGNVRELRSVLQRALVFSPGEIIDADSLGLKDRSSGRTFTTHFPGGQSLNEMLDELKQSLIEEALRRTGGRRKEAANLLGVTRSSLKHHMRSKGSREARLDHGS